MWLYEGRCEEVCGLKKLLCTRDNRRTILQSCRESRKSVVIARRECINSERRVVSWTRCKVEVRNHSKGDGGGSGNKLSGYLCDFGLFVCRIGC